MNGASRAILACLALLIAVVALVRLPGMVNHIQDDGFIYFRIAENAAHGHGPVFNAGERVDAATSPVWLWLLALSTWLGIPVQQAAAFLGVLALGIALFVSARWAMELGGEQPTWALVVACAGSLLLLLDDRFWIYAFSGMETMLCAATWTIALCGLIRVMIQRRPSRGAGWWALVAALVRPEFVVFVAGAAAVGLLRRSVQWKALVRLLLPVFVGGGLYLLAHTLYFGNPLPNTYYAKRALDWAHARIGLSYLAGVPRAFPWILLVLLPLAMGALRGAAFAFLAGLLLYVLHVARLGGDHFEFDRPFLYVMPTMTALLGAAAARFVVSRGSWRVGVVAGLVLAALFWTARTHVRGDAYHWVQLSARLGTALAKTYPAETKLGLFALGATGYTSRLPVVDALGIADPHVARRDLSHEHVCALDIGHERGDPAYVLQHADVIVFFGAYGPVPYESLDEIREGFYSHKKFIAVAREALKQGQFHLRNIEFMPGAYWAVLERAS